MTSRTAASWVLGFSPALLWLAFIVVKFGPERGYSWAVALGALSGLGVLGLTALFIAYFPWTMERLGFRRVGAFLRRWWDEDAL